MHRFATGVASFQSSPDYDAKKQMKPEIVRWVFDAFIFEGRGTKTSKHRVISCTKPKSLPGDKFTEIETIKREGKEQKSQETSLSEIETLKKEGKEQQLQDIDLYFDPALHVQKPYCVDEPNEVLQESQILSIGA
ncbi:hypothetical protein Fot_11113 [Forsythia ovata]|uniref:Uncharacterized protein n=1 Tax=Forsythia ovata TaxID=205694 RepID=A0ABD1WIT7_9LAMI